MSEVPGEVLPPIDVIRQHWHKVTYDLLHARLGPIYESAEFLREHPSMKALLAEERSKALGEAAEAMCSCTSGWLAAFEEHHAGCPSRALLERADREAS